MTTPSVCRIVTDLFERSSGVPRELRLLGAEVSEACLLAGDYDLGSGVLVERKTVADLHLSLERGRLWTQIGALRKHARLPYLVIEGRDLDGGGSIHPNAIRGACLAVIGQGVPILLTRDREDSARWLLLLAKRTEGAGLGRDRPQYAQRLKPPAEQVREAMLAAVPGISVVAARALIDRFGSVRAVTAAGEQEWRRVPGIGPARARALANALL